MHLRTVGPHGNFRVDDVRCRFVFDFDQFGGVFGECARIGNDCGHPFASVTHNTVGQRIARDLGRVDADRQRVSCGAELCTR